jgi:hypothetical protein
MGRVASADATQNQNEKGANHDRNKKHAKADWRFTTERTASISRPCAVVLSAHVSPKDRNPAFFAAISFAGFGRVDGIGGEDALLVPTTLMHVKDIDRYGSYKRKYSETVNYG